MGSDVRRNEKEAAVGQGEKEYSHTAVFCETNDHTAGEKLTLVH